MTEPSQYFKGRTVQEQMDEVVGYVDKRAEEVAAAKADTVLQPAEEAKTAAQAAAEAAEAAKNATIAALPDIRQDISGLKAEDTALDGRLDTVELKVTTAEGNIVTIQGQIVALQNVQADYVKKAGAAQTVTSQIMVPTTTTGLRDEQIANGTRIQNDLAAYEPMIRNTGNQEGLGVKRFPDMCRLPSILTNGTAGNYNSLYAVTVDQQPIYGVFEVYDRRNTAYGVYAGILRSHNISFTKLYGTLPENGMAVALNTARDKMYVFVKSDRTTADVRFCVHAWETSHVADIVVADNTVSETDETLVAGSNYYAVIKV